MARSKKVVVIDRRDWLTLETFSSIRHAAIYYNMGIESVRRCCSFKTYLPGEYIVFRYANDCDIDDEHEYRNGEPRPVEVHDKETGRVYKYPDTKTAAKDMDITQEAVRRYIRIRGWHNGKMYLLQEVAR